MVLIITVRQTCFTEMAMRPIEWIVRWGTLIAVNPKSTLCVRYQNCTEDTTVSPGNSTRSTCDGYRKQWAVDSNSHSGAKYLSMFSLCQAISLPSRGAIRLLKYGQPGMVAYNPWMIHVKFLLDEIHWRQWPHLSSSLLDPQQLAQRWHLVGTQ